MCSLHLVSTRLSSNPFTRKLSLRVSWKAVLTDGIASRPLTARAASSSDALGADSPLVGAAQGDVTPTRFAGIQSVR
jgi:hypothetical protein